MRNIIIALFVFIIYSCKNKEFYYEANYNKPKIDSVKIDSINKERYFLVSFQFNDINVNGFGYNTFHSSGMFSNNEFIKSLKSRNPKQMSKNASVVIISITEFRCKSDYESFNK